MSVVIKLMIAALVSIHQYIPDDDARYIKYYDDVRDVQEQDIFLASNQTCKYLMSVFVTAGLEVTLGSSNEALSKSFVGLLGTGGALDSALSVIDSGKYAEKFKEYNIDPQEVKTAIKKVCADDFSPLFFSKQERKEVFDFINSEIKVLSNVHLNSLGDFNYFGSVDIFDRSGLNIGTLDAVPRAWVPYKQMSKNLVLSILATEDEDFFEHKGVDSKAIARIVKQAMSGDRATGGSTVTMQLLKNMYFLNGPNSKYEELNTSNTFSTLLRKVREWYWALPYEKEHIKVLGDLSAKEYVLEMYFNLVDFGPRIQGVEQASYVYFNKSAEQLELHEAAYITTLLKAPSSYSNPDNYVERTEPRRNDYILTRAGAICENINSGNASFKNENVKKLKINICTSGKDKINQAFIDLEKQKPLPEWIRPTSAAVKDSSIHVRNEVKKWLNAYKFDPLTKPKEIIIETTINQKLQDVVFDSVKKRLDSYDDVRSSLQNIHPAKDDTGREARINESDVDYLVNGKLRSYLSRLNSKDTRYLYSISLSESKSSSLFSLTSIDFKNALEDFIETDKKIEDLNQIVSKSLEKQKNSFAEITFIKIEKDKFSFLNSKEIVSKLIESNLLDEKEKESINELVDLNYLRNRIYNNAITRMLKISPRPFLYPMLYTFNRSFITLDQKTVVLKESHKTSFSKRKDFYPGQFFWVSKEYKSATKEEQKLEDFKPEETGSYLLESPKLQAAVLVMDSNTGEVLANFGGYDPATSSFNRSSDAKRQAGSTLKPWIYYYALNKGFNPQDTLNNRSISFEIEGKRRPYTPDNYSNNLIGDIAFYLSLTNSQNIGTYSLIKNSIWGEDWKTNLEELKGFFEFIKVYDEVNVDLPLMLGGQELSVETLVSSFSFFANGKRIVKPKYIKYVTDYKGQNLYEMEQEFIDIPEFKNGSVFQIQSLLAEIGNTGTAASLNRFLRELDNGRYKESCYDDLIGKGKQTCFGGKTGTTNDSKDTWFIGFSKNFVIGVWVGYDLPRPLGYKATGGGIALPIFRDIIEQGLDYLPPIEKFLDSKAMPDSLERRVVYGNRACQDGDSNKAIIIFADKSSKEIPCSDRETRTQEEPNSQGQTSPGSNSSRICSCRSNGTGYAMDINYRGKFYQNYKTFTNKANCENDKANVRDSNGARVCF